MSLSSSHIAARIASGRPLPLLGRLLAATTARGELAPLDPATGGEVARDDRPAFVLSTEREATDGHILMQYWDLSRSTTAGIPILWNHDPDVLLGRWEDLRVVDLDGERALVGRAAFDLGDANAANRRRQIADGFLSAVSVGWVPGARIRRSELPKTSPAYRAPEEDECGQPAEGYVMGTPDAPNRLIETSIVPCPADAGAVVTERLYRGAEHTLDRAASTPGEIDRLLAVLARDPRVSAHLERLVRAEVERRLTPPKVRTVADLLRS